MIFMGSFILNLRCKSEVEPAGLLMNVENETLACQRCLFFANATGYRNIFELYLRRYKAIKKLINVKNNILACRRCLFCANTIVYRNMFELYLSKCKADKKCGTLDVNILYLSAYSYLCISSKQMPFKTFISSALTCISMLSQSLAEHLVTFVPYRKFILIDYNQYIICIVVKNTQLHALLLDNHMSPSMLYVRK